jgi:hypothetical protein
VYARALSRFLDDVAAAEARLGRGILCVGSAFNSSAARELPVIKKSLEKKGFKTLPLPYSKRVKMRVGTYPGYYREAESSFEASSASTFFDGFHLHHYKMPKTASRNVMLTFESKLGFKK